MASHPASTTAQLCITHGPRELRRHQTKFTSGNSSHSPRATVNVGRHRINLQRPPALDCLRSEASSSSASANGALSLLVVCGEPNAASKKSLARRRLRVRAQARNRAQKFSSPAPNVPPFGQKTSKRIDQSRGKNTARSLACPTRQRPDPSAALILLS